MCIMFNVSIRLLCTSPCTWCSFRIDLVLWKVSLHIEPLMQLLARLPIPLDWKQSNSLLVSCNSLLISRFQIELAGEEKTNISVRQMWKIWFFPDNYTVYVLSLSDLIPPGACGLLNPSTIYANNEVSLAEVDIYGFDYDYTLALYSNALHSMIYNAARGFLVDHFKVFCLSFLHLF